MTSPHLTAWGWYWVALIFAFLLPELYWLAVNSANTLSEQLWGLEQLDLAHPLNLSEWTWVHWLVSVALWSLFGWLSVHLPFGWLR